LGHRRQSQFNANSEARFHTGWFVGQRLSDHRSGAGETNFCLAVNKSNKHGLIAAAAV